MDATTLKAMSSSKNEHWCTPRVILDPINKKFGQIGLDPCSNSKSLVGAKVEWCGPGGCAKGCPQDGSSDGLAKLWTGHGLVYVNPPYGRKIRAWTKKCAKEALEGTEIILLGPARTDTKFFQDDIVPHASAILFLRGRLTFEGAPAPALFPSFLAYYGPRPSDFMMAFLGLGWFHTGLVYTKEK